MWAVSRPCLQYAARRVHARDQFDNEPLGISPPIVPSTMSPSCPCCSNGPTVYSSTLSAPSERTKKVRPSAARSGFPSSSRAGESPSIQIVVERVIVVLFLCDPDRPVGYPSALLCREALSEQRRLDRHILNEGSISGVWHTWGYAATSDIGCMDTGWARAFYGGVCDSGRGIVGGLRASVRE